MKNLLLFFANLTGSYARRLNAASALTLPVVAEETEPLVTNEIQEFIATTDTLIETRVQKNKAISG